MHKFKFYHMPDHDRASQKAANLIAAQIHFKPDSVIGLPTGSTPIETYEKLALMHENGELDFSEVRTFNLDEYLGLPSSDPQSYHYFMHDNLFSKVNIAPDRNHFPDQNAADTEQACHDYEAQIAAHGGMDFMFLGIGSNGHIGFNEPSDEFSTMTNRVALTEDTIQANARFFENPDDVPKEAISMGIKTIMGAKKIILLANGPAKKEAVHQALYGPITPALPASILQVHPDVTVIWSD